MAGAASCSAPAKQCVQRRVMLCSLLPGKMRNRGLGGGLKVYCVERIQNTANQTRFLNCATGAMRQLLLFHGTRASVVDAIVDEGTDFRLHDDNGTRFGYGSYFAVYASYTAQIANERLVWILVIL